MRRQIVGTMCVCCSKLVVVSVSWSTWEYYDSLNGISVHWRVTPSIMSPVAICQKKKKNTREKQWEKYNTELNEPIKFTLPALLDKTFHESRNIFFEHALWTSVYQYMNLLALEKPVSQEKKRLTSPEVRAAVRRLQPLNALQAERSFFLLEYQEEDKRWQAPTPFPPCAPTLQYLRSTLSLSSHSSLKRNLVCR